MSKNYTHIVVGGGTSGCLLAKRLSEDPTRRVALIESGNAVETWRQLWMKVPVGYLKSIGNPDIDWMFKTVPQKGLNNRRLLYPRGRTLGGCSAINGMIYMRGQRRDYDGWAACAGDDSWRWDHVLPLFKKHEDYRVPLSSLKNASPDDVRKHHGMGGEWPVSQQRVFWPVLKAVEEACVNLGIPPSDDFNQGSNFGVGYFDVTQRRGMRVHTGGAFIHQGRGSKPNLTVIGRCIISKVRFDSNGTAKAVQIANPSTGELDGDIIVDPLDKRACIILCSGAVGTPGILERSGIGRSDVLLEHGITPLLELAGVGQNLQDHLQIRTHCETSLPTLNTKSASVLGRISMGLQYIFNQSGPLSMAPSQLGVFAKTDASMEYADAQFHVQPLSLDAFGSGSKSDALPFTYSYRSDGASHGPGVFGGFGLHSYDAATLSVCNLNPTSRGSVHIASSDPRDHPLIDPNYLSTDADKAHAVKCVKLARSIYRQAPFAQHVVREVQPSGDAQTDEEILDCVENIATTIFHPVGTCAMGREEDPTAVVDSSLSVFGVQGLFVCDASIMPRITSGNTNTPTMMIAEKLAAQLMKTAP